MDRSVRLVPRFLSAIVFTLALASPLGAVEYFWGHPVPTGNVLRALDFADDGLTGIAVGEYGATFRTTDGGATWADLTPTDHLAPHLADVRFLSNGALLAVGSAPGIFRSEDLGAGWTPIANPSTLELFSLEGFGTTLYAAGENGHVYRSSDEGDTWAGVTPLSTPEIVDQHWTSATTGYVLGRLLARRTTDGGQTWQTIPGVTEDFFFPGDIQFLDALNGWMPVDFTTYRTTNGGASWFEKHATPFNGPIYQEEAAFLDASTRWIATEAEGAEIWKTTNDGLAWTQVYEHLEIGGIFDLVRLPDGALVAVSTGGDLLRSTDGGGSWVNATITVDGETRRPFEVIECFPSGRAYCAGPGSWLRSEDSGRTWTRPETQMPLNSATCLDFRTEDFGFVGGGNGVNQSAIARTTDGGASWTTHVVSPTYIGYAVSIAAPTDDVVFAAFHGGQGINWVYRSTDAGVTWTVRSNGLPTNQRFWGIEFLDGENGYLGGGNFLSPRLWRTTNGGASWTQVPPNLPGNDEIQDMHWSDLERGVVATRARTYRTTNGGAQWIATSATETTRLDFWDDLRGFAVDYGPHVWTTLDGGVTWGRSALPFSPVVHDVAATPSGFLVIGSWSSILGGDLLEPAGVDPSTPSGAPPSRLAVVAFPNPTAGPTVLRFSSRKEGTATVDLHDAGGRRMSTARRFVARGAGDVAVDLRSLVPGVYFARVRTPDGRDGGTRITVSR